MITLTFGTTSVQLRNPDFENVEGIELSRINRRTRGGDLIIFRDPIWPKSRTFDLHFSYLSEDQTRSLLQFLDTTLGQQITMLDFENRLWIGIITTPLGEVVQPGRENKTAHFIFQGELV